jgi:hypothetical protein
MAGRIHWMENQGLSLAAGADITRKMAMRYGLAIAACALLAACGQKGPLIAVTEAASHRTPLSTTSSALPAPPAASSASPRSTP